MIQRGWWIAAASGIIAVILLVVLAVRGPAPGRAPAQTGGAERPSGEPPAGGGSLRVAVDAVPAGSSPEWTLEVRERAGGLHSEKGTGKRECVIGPLPAGRVLCTLRASGFVGETRMLEIGQGDTTVALALRRFGRVSGFLRCDALPVGGTLVRLVMDPEARSTLMQLVPEDRVQEAGWSTESDETGHYVFDRVPPAPGYTLVAADFDHAPAHAGPIEVKPGEEATADFTLIEGAHLAGRVVDSRGAPCGGATIHVYRQQEKRGLRNWVDEARARTDDDGHFLTPALAGRAVRMLKAWVAVDGIQEVIQHETEPPERGTKDVGTLAPLPGVVRFEAESGAECVGCSITVAVNGDPLGVGQTIVLSGIPLDEEGRARVAGLPIGEGSFTVLNPEGRAVADGQFRTTGRDTVVRIPRLGEPSVEPPPPAEKLIVEVADTGEEALVLLVADGSFVMWRRVGKGDRNPVVEPVSPGRYMLHVSAGDRYAEQEITQIEGQDLRVSVLPDRIGRAVTVLVLEEGKPVPGARVQVRGFVDEARGLRAPWAEAGGDGRALLRALPQDLKALTITVLDKDGFGRTYTMDVADTDDVTVDLAAQPEAGR